jgi:hypothetical protein
MKKQKIFGIAVLVVVAMLVVATGVVFAAGLTQAGPPYSVEDEGDEYGPYWGLMHGRRGGWSSEAPLPMHDAMVQAVADATGLTVEEIDARIAEGERLFTIALDAGMEEADFIELMAETREAFLAEALENGLISEEQYQWMLDRGSGSSSGQWYGGCHRFDGDDFTTGGRGPGRGRRGRR